MDFITHANLSSCLEFLLTSDAKALRLGQNGLSIAYHDQEWGVPVHDDRKLFEFLILEGAQAGLSWEIILNKREGYRAAFSDFDPAKVAQLRRAQA